MSQFITSIVTNTMNLLLLTMLMAIVLFMLTILALGLTALVCECLPNTAFSKRVEKWSK